MDSSDVERMRLKKQQQKARRKEKKAAKERAAEEEAVHISEALRRLRMLWPGLTRRTLKAIRMEGMYSPINDLTYGDWEQIGRDMANCDELEVVYLGSDDARELNDVDQKISSLFQGWTRSNSIRNISLRCSELSTVGLQSMVPFLMNANNLQRLDLSDTNIQSEGFNALFRALRDSPIAKLKCENCGIESIEVDAERFPKQLSALNLDQNNFINAAGCHEIAKLLQRRDATLSTLSLYNNDIDDGAVDILANSLQNNSSLCHLFLTYNGISIEGMKLLLNLVNDISSIKATLQTNSTLHSIHVGRNGEEMEEVREYIEFACRFTSNRQKVIHTQLHSMRRANLCRLQGIRERFNAAFYGEFDPLHLPEILALVGQTHGLGELHMALRSSIATLFSTVDRVTCLEQKIAYHEARVASLRAEVAIIKRAEGNVAEVRNDSLNKRRRI